MNKFNQTSGDKNINPFELGTNEYNYSQTTQSPPTSSFSNGFIGPVADFSYAEASGLPNLAYNVTPSENPNVSSRNSTLAFGSNGQDFLTFNQPPEWYIRDNSLKVLEKINGEGVNSALAFNTSINQPDVPQTLNVNLKFELDKKPLDEQTSPAKEVLNNAKKIISPVPKVSKSIFKDVVFIFKPIFSLFFESFLGFGAENKKPPTKEEIEQKDKEAKRGVNKKKFWQNLAELSRPTPIIGVVKEEMIVTNQLNGFYEEYKGVVTRDARITEYHRANRAKKEIENKAAQIQAQRSAKMIKAGVGKKPMGMPQQARAGELLMGTENPSHFTKALG